MISSIAEATDAQSLASSNGAAVDPAAEVGERPLSTTIKVLEDDRSF